MRGEYEARPLRRGLCWGGMLFLTLGFWGGLGATAGGAETAESSPPSSAGGAVTREAGAPAVREVRSLSEVPVSKGEPTFFPLYFSPGDASLRVDSEAILSYMAQMLLNQPLEGVIRIEGRSDGAEISAMPAADKDPKAARLQLSRLRAEAVKEFLVGKGLAESRFVVIGLGSSSPLGPLETERDRERNRVVTLNVVRPGTQTSFPGVVRKSTSTDGGKNTVSTTAQAAQVPEGRLEVNPSVIGPAASEPAKSPGSVEIVAIRERETPRGPAVVETVQLGLYLIKRDGPGSAGPGGWPINEFLQQEMPTLERLFRSGLSRERSLVGETRILVELDATGKVTRATVTLPYAQPAFHDELVAYLNTWELPQPPGKDVMRFEFSLTVQATFQPYLMPP